MSSVCIKVELGVLGYHHSYVELCAPTVVELRHALDALKDDFAFEVECRQEEDGDLRAFTRENASGYPSVTNLEYGENLNGNVVDIWFLDENGEVDTSKRTSNVFLDIIRQLNTKMEE